MSDICAKNRIFAPSFFGMTYILMEVRDVSFQLMNLDNSPRNLEQGNALSPIVGCVLITYRIRGVGRSLI